MHPIELRAYKLKIETGDTNTVNEAIEEILEILSQGEFPADLIASVLKALREGKYITAENLCRVIIAAGSVELFDVAETRSVLGRLEYARLFALGFPHGALESRMCRELYQCFQKDDEPMRRVIVEAMKTAGSQESLDMLEVVHYELAPKVSRRKYDLLKARCPQGDPAGQLIAALELNSTEAFLKTVADASRAIRARVHRSHEDTGDTLPNS